MKQTEFYYVSDTPNRVTICGRVDQNHMCFGVARCGVNENYNENLGMEIALNRSKIQKYCCVPMSELGRSKRSITKNFNLIANSITSHVSSVRQWTPNLNRN